MLIGGLSFTTALFVFQACYGMPQDWQDDVFIQGKVISSTTSLPVKGIKVESELYEHYGITDSQGEFGFYRVVFTSLVEADDPVIRKAIIGMYRRFHELIQELLDTNREREEESSELSADATAWALIGLATVSNIIRELELLRPRQREDMFVATAKYLVKGGSP